MREDQLALLIVRSGGFLERRRGTYRLAALPGNNEFLLLAGSSQLIL
jgi:hypothetical protein